MGYNSQHKLQDNIEAIRIALQWKEGQLLSSIQLEALKQYAGFGGIKAVLYPHDKIEQWVALNASQEDLKLYPKIMELHQLLKQHLNETEYKQSLDSIKNSVLTAFYTPAIAPQTLYTVLQEQGIQPKNLYEPSSGAGIFIAEAANAFPGLQNITAVEKDLLSGRVLAALCSSLKVPVNVNIAPFEQTPVEESNQYDVIVSNIPFGNFPVYDPAYKSEALSGKIHNYFFAKGLDR